MGVSICSDRELRVIDKGGKRGKNMEIGNKIKEARNGAGLTQDQAAEKIMVSRQTISNWENGVSHSYRYNTKDNESTLI